MRPTAIAFDVVETLFSLEALDAPLAAIGAPPGLRELWFTRLLRDGFALAAADSYVPFAQVADGALASVLPTATSEQRRGCSNVSPASTRTPMLDLPWSRPPRPVSESCC